MNLPRLQDLKVKGKKVLLRLDLDVPLRQAQGKLVVADDTRLRAAIPTIKHLTESGTEKIIVLGHVGRPEGKIEESLSTKPIAEYLKVLLVKENIVLASDNFNVEENLRFNPGEEANDLEFTKKLAKIGDVYVNDAFATCHREAASIVGLPKLLPHAAGLDLQKEVEVLSGLLDKPEHPIVFVLGGGKLDKVLFVDKLLNMADWVLVGGVLPQKVKSYCRDDSKMCVVAARVGRDGKDITPDSARNFAEIIKSAKTIIWNGPTGDVDNGYWESTQIIEDAIADNNGYKVAGGGDTIGVIDHLKIRDKFDFISTGGGAFLEFLAYGDLPGLTALRA